MVVKLIEDKALWDKHIEESPYGTLFHLWDFLKIIERHSGCKLYPYGIYRGDELVCLFPLFIKSFMGVKMVFSPPPGMAVPNLGFVMGAVYDKLKQRRKEMYINGVADEIEAEIKKMHANYVQISTVNRFVDVRPFRWNGYSVQMKYSYAIDLNMSLDEIWGNFDDSLKREISDGEKMQLSIRPTDDVDQFYHILQGQFERKGQIPPMPGKAYLKDVIAAFPDNLKISFLYKGDKIVDLVAYYQYKKHFAFWLWLTEHDTSLNSSEYIAWDYIRNKKAEGLESLEISGASVKRHFAFKSKFNAPLVYNFSITRNDMAGRVGEGMYSSLLKVHI